MQTTHATYLVNHHAFGVGYGDDASIRRAKDAENMLGYRIRATSVTATTGGVVTAGLQNDGVAPFYYELRLRVASMVAGCESVQGEVVLPQRILPGVQNAVDAAVTLPALQASSNLSCMSQLSISLACPRCYAEKPVLLANQGTDVATGELALAFSSVVATVDGDVNGGGGDGGGGKTAKTNDEGSDEDEGRSGGGGEGGGGGDGGGVGGGGGEGDVDGGGGVSVCASLQGKMIVLAVGATFAALIL